jgi:hypothetical protein
MRGCAYIRMDRGCFGSNGPEPSQVEGLTGKFRRGPQPLKSLNSQKIVKMPWR